MKIYCHRQDLRIAKCSLWIVFFLGLFRIRKVCRRQKTLIMPPRNRDGIFKAELNVSDALAHLLDHDPVGQLIMFVSALLLLGGHVVNIVNSDLILTFLA